MKSSVNLVSWLGDNLTFRVVVWLTAWPQFSVCLMLLLLVFSSLAVVYSAHATRKLYGDLQTLQAKQDFLDSEFERLLLEQSAWANYPRVDLVSRNELGMTSPDADDVIVVSK
ncbi:MAG: cell division protein FtsL [Pseudomonadales bacterium]